MRFHIISVEGSIGSSKTTRLDLLRTHFQDYSNVVFLKEPVDEWSKIKDENDKTILQHFYENQEQHAFAFQMMAYITRLSMLRNTLRQISFSQSQCQYQHNTTIIFTERSLYTDKYVFAKMLFDQGKIAPLHYQIYNHWFDEFAAEFPIQHIVYIRTAPNICHQRIQKRARPGEEIIPLAYLEQCDQYHENFIAEMAAKGTQIITLDGNVNLFAAEDGVIAQDTLKTWFERITDLCQSELLPTKSPTNVIKDTTFIDDLVQKYPVGC